MKKLFLAFGLLFFAGFTQAATLTGTITDADNPDKLLRKIKVVVGGEEFTTDEDGIYKIRGFNPSGDMAITFDHTENPAKYLPIAGVISATLAPIVVLTYDGEELEKIGDTYTLNMTMVKPPEVIISGKITAKRNDDTQNLLWDKIEITAKDADGEILQVNTKEKDDEYTVVSKLFY